MIFLTTFMRCSCTCRYPAILCKSLMNSSSCLISTYFCSMAVCRGKLKVKPRCQGINIYTIRGTLWSLAVLLDYLYDGEVGTHFEWYFVLDAWLAAQDLNLGKSTMKNFAQAFLKNWLARDRNWEDLFERRHDLFSIRDGGDSQEILLRELNKRHPLPIVLRGSNRR